MKELIQKHASQELAVKQYLQHYLDKVKDEQTLNSMLRELGEYYEADRAYIFEADYSREVFNNTFEWCREGVSAEIDNLQNVPFDGLDCWFEAFEERGDFFISSLSEDCVPGTATYDILEPQGIQSLMAAPIKLHGRVAGFLGVDNPSRNTDALLLLSVAAATCYSEIATERMLHAHKADEERQEHMIRAFALPYDIAFAVDGNSGDTVCCHMSEATEKQYGRNPEIMCFERMIAHYADNIVYEDDRHLFDGLRSLPQVVRMLSEKQSHAFVYRVLRDGQMAYYRCMLVMPDPAGKDFALALRNVSAERQQEIAQQQQLKDALDAAQAASRAKSEFLSNMSHDIRTPMNAIMGFARLMEKELDSPELLKDHIRKIEISGNHLTTLINNVLELSRLESGKETLLETPMDLLVDVLPISSMFGSEIAAKGLTYSNEIETVHRYVWADAAKMRSITMNLVSNAIKYTPNGGKVHMSFREIPCEREGYGTFVLTAEDTGVGMSDDFQKDLFEVFSREHTTTETKIYGAGLGMAIVKRYLDMMGGRVEVESRPGVGTTVRVIVDHRIADELPHEGNTDPADLRNRRILLVEDNDLNAEIAIAILEDFGARVERAEDGEQGVAMMEAADPAYFDLVLMDIQMPGIDGYEAARRIRSMSDCTKASIPMVAMTANAFAEDKDKALASGMNAHLAKPIEIPKLTDVLKAVL
ncbi:MAG: response regulator [Clostridia bacterium]|nr:response regulator [Clostridia bacterium]